MGINSISGNVIDIVYERIYPATVKIQDGKISEIISEPEKKYDNYILPGFIDAHVHIESSMLVPTEFARLAVVHGTVATVSDPHEIANVLGMDGINFMIENSRQTAFKFYFGAPSCVPATGFESAGAEITADNIKELLARDDIKYMSEMMNFPGVLFDAPDVLEKLKIAKESGKPVDGHAPGVTGDNIKKYINAGISTDHECFTLNEAVDKIYHGMKILIREGSAAKNFDALHKLIETRPEMCMLCSDDKHPDDLVEGHINQIVKRALAMDYGLMRVLRAAILNPVDHYGLDVGLLQEGDDADFIEIDNLKDFNVLKTVIQGNIVAENGKTMLENIRVEPVNNFVASKKSVDDFKVGPGSGKIKVIEALDGELITNLIEAKPKTNNGNIISDVDNDILKISVVNRYKDTKPAVGFIKNFGLKKGAIASSVGHDSHNIIAVGTDDESLCNAVNAVIESKGGMVVYDGETVYTLPLPVAGLMSNGDCFEVAEKYSELDKLAKGLGSKLRAPFMTLSFMALLVIPKLKLSDKGLFDGEKFEFTSLQD